MHICERGDGSRLGACPSVRLWMACQRRLATKISHTHLVWSRRSFLGLACVKFPFCPLPTSLVWDALISAVLPLDDTFLFETRAKLRFISFPEPERLK